ncbi:MAG: hypothetical protein R6U15_01715, partial [Candidatus Izemoplasmatales bacterium]
YIHFIGIERGEAKVYIEGNMDILFEADMDILIEALTTGKDKYYEQLNIYNKKLSNDKKLIEEILN